MIAHLINQIDQDKHIVIATNQLKQYRLDVTVISDDLVIRINNMSYENSKCFMSFKIRNAYLYIGIHKMLSPLYFKYTPTNSSIATEFKINDQVLRYINPRSIQLKKIKENMVIYNYYYND